MRVRWCDIELEGLTPYCDETTLMPTFNASPLPEYSAIGNEPISRNGLSNSPYPHLPRVVADSSPPSSSLALLHPPSPSIYTARPAQSFNNLITIQISSSQWRHLRIQTTTTCHKRTLNPVLFLDLFSSDVIATPLCNCAPCSSDLSLLRRLNSESSHAYSLFLKRARGH